MNHYSAFLRPSQGKSTANASSSNNENDENSSIKNLFFKHLSKSQQSSSTSNAKGTVRGILGEVGNTALSNKSSALLINRTKLVQQQSIATIIEAKPTAVAPSLATAIPIVIHRFDEIVLNDEKEVNRRASAELSSKLIQVPAQFDCDSGDTQNIITAAEYVVDICHYWRALEQQTPIRSNFLAHRAEGEREGLFFGEISGALNVF